MRIEEKVTEYAGFINVKTRKPLVMRINSEWNYDDTKEFVAKHYGEDYKFFLGETTTRSKMLEKLNELIAD